MKSSTVTWLLIVFLGVLLLGWMIYASPVGSGILTGRWNIKGLFHSFSQHSSMMGRSCPMRGMGMGRTSQNTGRRAWDVPSTAADMKNPFHGEQAILDGKKLYARNCASCHGVSGQGNGPVGVAMSPPPANLVSLKVQNQADGVLFWKIENGNPPMPGFRGVLSDESVWKIILYLRTLASHQKLSAKN